jgi:UDP-2,3-diacylglucosamine hydrolase
MHLANNKKIYFASDQHFAPTAALSLPREKRFVAWLDEVKRDAEAFF